MFGFPEDRTGWEDLPTKGLLMNFVEV